MVSSPVVRVIKNVMPHGLVMSIVRSQAVRRWRIKTQTSANLPVVKTKYSYSAAVDFLSANDLPRDSVIAGSIPEASLEFCTKILDELLPSGVPLIGLHIGNFVGISLSHFVDYARRKSEQSMIVSIDPNLICMGILDPQKHVIALLNYFGLQKNVMITVGYSGEKSISNDGYAFIDNKGEEYDPFAGYVKEQSCESILASYCLISESRFDFAVLDGNHERSYLQKEIAVVKRLLKPSGVLILDDVADSWADIKKEYEELRSQGWGALGADGRVGILQSA